MKPATFAGIALAVLTAAPALAQKWDLYHREVWLQDRIEHGQKDGSLDGAEARRVQDSLKKIQHDEAFDSRTNNGKLSDKDRATIEARLDDLSDHIKWAKAGDTHRPW